jgi:hypothetical protein
MLIWSILLIHRILSELYQKPLPELTTVLLTHVKCSMHNTQYCPASVGRLPSIPSPTPLVIRFILVTTHSKPLNSPRVKTGLSSPKALACLMGIPVTRRSPAFIFIFYVFLPITAFLYALLPLMPSTCCQLDPILLRHFASGRPL